MMALTYADIELVENPKFREIVGLNPWSSTIKLLLADVHLWMQTHNDSDRTLKENLEAWASEYVAMVEREKWEDAAARDNWCAF